MLKVSGRHWTAEVNQKGEVVQLTIHVEDDWELDHIKSGVVGTIESPNGPFRVRHLSLQLTDDNFAIIGPTLVV